jgi:hypothetical protein
MKMKSKLSVSTLILIAVSILFFFIFKGPPFVIGPPRPHFWDYPKLEEATYSSEILSDGKLLIQIRHPLLKGVTPEMISWWYKNLASGKYSIQGVKYEFYHLFHLTEHGKTTVVKAATDGSAGMGKGATIYRQERFGKFLSKGYGRVEEFSQNGFVVTPIMGPLDLGRIEHQFISKEKGTYYTVRTVLGSDLPIIGSVINFYIRNCPFRPEIVQEWIRHQVEEVGSLVNYLPQIYSQQISYRQTKKTESANLVGY